MSVVPQRLVVGLGNPGLEYAPTRHNVGFRVVEALARRVGASLVEDSGLRGRLAIAEIGGRPTGLLAPSTFMNRSGESVAAALECWPALSLEHDLLVVYDDLDLPPGRLRLRPGGSAGGHRGMRDIARALASETVPRLRFGIGHPGAAGEVIDFVLAPFAPQEEAEILPTATERAADAVEAWVREGLVAAMSRFNAAA